MVGVAQRPGLVRVKVRVSSDASAGEVGVGQETPLTVKRGAVTVETRGEEDHDVGLLALVLDLRVWHLLNGIREEQSGVKSLRNNIRKHRAASTEKEICISSSQNAVNYTWMFYSASPVRSNGTPLISYNIYDNI